MATNAARKLSQRRHRVDREKNCQEISACVKRERQRKGGVEWAEWQISKRKCIGLCANSNAILSFWESSSEAKVAPKNTGSEKKRVQRMASAGNARVAPADVPGETDTETEPTSSYSSTSWIFANRIILESSLDSPSLPHPGRSWVKNKLTRSCE